MHVAQDDLPFGGVGASGMGKYHGIEGFRTLSHPKGIYVQGRFNATRRARAWPRRTPPEGGHRWLITTSFSSPAAWDRLVTERLRAQNVPVRVLIRREDERAAEVRALGAEGVTGDPTRPETVAAALNGVRRTYFGLSVSPDHLLAATVMATVAKAHGELDLLVNTSQMTVSQMTATSTAESHQQRLHWLAEQVLDWSGLPVVHVRPTTFLDNPLFTALAARSIRESGTLALPFGTGRTSPVAADVVAQVHHDAHEGPGADQRPVRRQASGPAGSQTLAEYERWSRMIGVAARVPLDWTRLPMA